jgi:glycosyltransferase involved in cell wall biosynthesis
MTLYFIGPTQVEGEQTYRKTILNLLIEKKIRYHFISDPSDSELSDYVSQLEMIVVPSINQTEAYGMVQPESMCRGVAVIATNLPGIRIPIKKTHMGLLVPPKNPVALAQAIQKIHDNLSHYVNPKNIQNVRLQFEPTKTLEIIYNTMTQ